MFNQFKRKPKCYGNYSWEIKCDVCEYVDKCIDCTNSHISGTKVRAVNRSIPIPQPIRLINKEFINIEYFQYRVMTKDDFIRYMVNSRKASNINKNTFKTAEDRWDRIRKGYNFVIAVGKEDWMFYSVDSFNELIGGSIDDKE